jgi:[protein-PII] uridylyltransferase
MNLGSGVASAKLTALASGDPWRRIEREFASTGDATTVHRGLTLAIDDLVAKAYQAAIEPVLPQGAAMLALGEYGRAQLFPYSDVNVLIVLESEASWVALREVLSEFVRELWDLGLRVNHSVRTIAECVDVRDENLDLRIGLLDRRFVAGDKYVQAQLKNRLPEFLGKQAQKLAQQLCHEARLRYAKQQNTIRHLQPDVQETPGGFRDLQLIRCLACLGSERQPLLDPFGPAASFLGTARCFLHYRARGDRNLLDFDAQESIAQQPFSRHGTRVEWMREYYEHAAMISKHARRALESSEKSESSLLGNFREWRSRLSNTDFTVSRDRLLLRNPGQIEEDPDLLLRLIEFMARHDIRPSSSTESRLEAARPALAAYCAAPRPMWATLKNILALPYIAQALRTLQNTGLISALFPEWNHIENLNTADQSHSYTVDEHVLVACERVGDLRNTSDPTRKRFAELLSEIDNPAVLLFALLYHDMGKDSPGADSLRLSVSHVAEAARRIEMPPEEQSDVEFLIEHQLDLAEGMSARDPADPATPRWLAKRIGTIERLRLLAILTYADISSAHSDSMSPWRTDQLWMVHQVTRQELTRELETDRIQEIPRTLPRHADFIKGFPVRYLRVHQPAEIESHLELYELSRPTGVAVQLQREHNAYRMTLVARDMPFLFASLAGALSSFGLDILKAEAFSNAQGLILDTFVFADPKRALEQNPPEAERLQDMIRRVALGKTDGQKLLRNRAPLDHKKRSTEARVHFDSDACDTATLVEISADDRPGLLCSLAAVFSGAGCNIDVVLIDTKGHRAIDVFYVAYEGRKLTLDMQAALREKLRAAC